MFPLLSSSSHLAKFEEKTERQYCRRSFRGKGLPAAGHLGRSKVRIGVRRSDSLAWLESTTCIVSRARGCSSALASPEPVRTLIAARRTFDPSNKAPEPTAGLVTSRATLLLSELKHRAEPQHPARAVPNPAVAQLYQNVGGSRITNKILGRNLQ